jgi:thiol-disulfide isomerase/thioredoxin
VNIKLGFSTLASNDVASFIFVLDAFHEHAPVLQHPAMILRPSPFLSRSIALRIPSYAPCRNLFGASSTRSHKNRTFDSIRRPEDLHTLTLLSAAEHRPLITLWSASWCTTCQAVKPLVKSLIEDEGVGQAEGGLGFAEVELDSTLIGDLGVKYMVSHELYCGLACEHS